VDQFEAGAASWARRNHGAVVEVHAYALADGATPDGVRAEMRRTLNSVYPELAGATVRAQEFLLRADCPLVGVQPWASRPGVRTPDPRVVLAGDGVRCDFPVALMERAATTGFLAANDLLSRWGLAGHDLWTVPLRGRFPVRRPTGRTPATPR
jgi:isorenieratene synthase